jgi:probable HAF family extracellular repeat protein
MNLRKAVCFLAVLLFASVPLALAQGTYTQIDYPGAVSTFCSGINTAGDIVCSYLDGVSAGHGFLLSGGTYTTIDRDGQNTSLAGINDMGQVVGSSDTGFVYNLQTQKFREVEYPGTKMGTYPTSINNAGTIAGYFLHRDNRGFDLIGSTYSEIAPPGATISYVNGVSGSGKLVGFELRPNYFNFAYVQGKYHKLNIPSAPEALVYGINPAGNALVGTYIPSPGLGVGFVYQDKNLQTLQFPGSDNTFPTGINDAGEVVGYFYDSNGITHGFTWTPPADAAKR